MEFDKKLLFGILIGMGVLYVVLALGHITPKLGAEAAADKWQALLNPITAKINTAEADLAATTGNLTLLRTQIKAATAVVTKSGDDLKAAKDQSNLALKNVQDAASPKLKENMKIVLTNAQTNAKNLEIKFHMDQQKLAAFVQQHDDADKQRILRSKVVKLLHDESKRVHDQADAARASDVKKAHDMAVEAAKAASNEATRIAKIAAKNQAEAVKTVKTATDKAAKEAATKLVKDHAKMVNDAKLESSRIAKQLKNTLDAAKKASDNILKMAGQKKAESALMSLTIAKAHASATTAAHEIAQKAMVVSKSAAVKAKVNTPVVMQLQQHTNTMADANKKAIDALNSAIDALKTAELAFQNHN